jgi:hypothetical protein
VRYATRLLVGARSAASSRRDVEGPRHTASTKNRLDSTRSTSRLASTSRRRALRQLPPQPQRRIGVELRPRQRTERTQHLVVPAHGLPFSLPKHHAWRRKKTHHNSSLYSNGGVCVVPVTPVRFFDRILPTGMEEAGG